MVNSIKHFEEESIKIFVKLENDFFKNPEYMAEYVCGITKELHKIGLSMVKESLENMNQLLKDSVKRKSSWVIEKDSRKQLVTSMGTVNFTKTLFANKETGKMEYLLDRILGLKKHERMTEDAEAAILKEVVQSSYRHGGEDSFQEGSVSRQTEKNKLHVPKFPENAEKPKQKKVVEYLYIEADKDHASLRFWEKKGELTENENHQKNNGLITKLVYVHEGVKPESPQSSQYRLVHPYYFWRVCDGKENDQFWDEIYRYIENHYALEKVKRIYLNADGGGWIEAGRNRIGGVSYVLDEFHLRKYLIRLTSHMKDSAGRTEQRNPEADKRRVS